MSPPEMEQMLKADIDRYHDVRKRLIQAMKFNKKMIDKMNEMATTSQTPPKP
jgi:response regulator of citrate/malate metabolism